MKRILLIAVLLTLFSVAVPTKGYSAPLWMTDIVVRVANDIVKIRLGANTDATDYNDSKYDAYLVFTDSDQIRAYFYHPEWGLSNPYYWIDVRDTLTPKEWSFEVTSLYTSRDITLSWDLGGVPENLSFTLYDDYAGASVDMRASSFYTYYNTVTSPRSFRVVVEAIP